MNAPTNLPTSNYQNTINFLTTPLQTHTFTIRPLHIAAIAIALSIIALIARHFANSLYDAGLAKGNANQQDQSNLLEGSKKEIETLKQQLAAKNEELASKNKAYNEASTELTRSNQQINGMTTELIDCRVNLERLTANCQQYEEGVAQLKKSVEIEKAVNSQNLGALEIKDARLNKLQKQLKEALARIQNLEAGFDAAAPELTLDLLIALATKSQTPNYLETLKLLTSCSDEANGKKSRKLVFNTEEAAQKTHHLISSFVEESNKINQARAAVPSAPNEKELVLALSTYDLLKKQLFSTVNTLEAEILNGSLVDVADKALARMSKQVSGGKTPASEEE